VLLSFALIAGCGGSNSIAPPRGASAVSLTMRDNPPAGVDVISFEVNVTGATLNPGNIDLLAGKGPIQIEVKRLEVETAFLSTASLPSGSGPFTSLNLTFANPELTFRNGTAAAIAGCNPGQVCEIKPTGTLAASISFNPALNTTANNSIGLQVDLDLMKLISNSLGVDFSAAGAVSVAQSQTKSDGELEDIDDLSGTVQNKGATTFDLMTSRGIVITGIQTDANTQFENFACNPVSFSNCVQNGQLVEVDLKMMAGGALLARKIEQENEAANEEDIEGIIFSVDALNGKFQMVAVENRSSLSSSTLLGSPINVTLQSGAGFKVDVDGLKNLSTALLGSFNGASALLVGQNVEVRRVSGDGSSANPIVADRVKLKMSRFTAKVKAKVDANTFTVDTTAIGLFKDNGIAEINVDASQAKFEGVSNVNGLKDASTPPADNVSLSGLLFKQTAPSAPLLVAKKVRKR
jgi:hypothetical protein